MLPPLTEATLAAAELVRADGQTGFLMRLARSEHTEAPFEIAHARLLQAMQVGICCLLVWPFPRPAGRHMTPAAIPSLCTILICAHRLLTPPAHIQNTGLFESNPTLSLGTPQPHSYRDVGRPLRRLLKQLGGGDVLAGIHSLLRSEPRREEVQHLLGLDDPDVRPKWPAACFGHCPAGTTAS